MVCENDRFGFTCFKLYPIAKENLSDVIEIAGMDYTETILNYFRCSTLSRSNSRCKDSRK